MLTDAGYDVVGEAANGQQALEMAVATTPDLITLDVILPDNTGLDVLKGIRQQQPDAKLVTGSLLAGRDIPVRWVGHDWASRKFSVSRSARASYETAMKSRDQEYRELFMAEALEYYDAIGRARQRCPANYRPAPVPHLRRFAVLRDGCAPDTRRWPRHRHRSRAPKSHPQRGGDGRGGRSARRGRRVDATIRGRFFDGRKDYGHLGPGSGPRRGHHVYAGTAYVHRREGRLAGGARCPRLRRAAAAHRYGAGAARRRNICRGWSLDDPRAGRKCAPRAPAPTAVRGRAASRPLSAPAEYCGQALEQAAGYNRLIWWRYAAG
nr:hypothetical protein [Tanacetum cinerariifolium]